VKSGPILAIHGGEPVRREMLPYARQLLDQDDINVVVETLGSDWLTTGPQVAAFERDFAGCVGAREAVAVSSGTAALHAAMHAASIGPGDEVLVPALTFLATANAVVFQGGTPVFADVCPDTLLLDPDCARRKITPRTRALVTVDYAGHPCDYGALQDMAQKNGLLLIDDACHALGADYQGRRIGALADLTVFSFHPAKHITTGEGGMIVTDSPEFADRMRRFRNHGITLDVQQRSAQGIWQYEMADLGYNYRLTDFQCALGRSQLRKLPGWVARRREIAQAYDAAFAGIPAVRPLAVRPNVYHAYHLYVVRLDLERLSASRDEIFRALRAEGIGVNVHYLPVPLQPFYQKTVGTRSDRCPVAFAASNDILSLPMFPGMTARDIEDVISACLKIMRVFELKN
jgi:perosamine synthetase